MHKVMVVSSLKSLISNGLMVLAHIYLNMRLNLIDWNVDNVNDQSETALDNIFIRMKDNWEYRGSRRETKVLRYEIFKSNIRQQLKSKRAQMKMRISKDLCKHESIWLDHWLHMVELTRDPRKSSKWMWCKRRGSTSRRSLPLDAPKGRSEPGWWAVLSYFCNSL